MSTERAELHTVRETCDRCKAYRVVEGATYDEAQDSARRDRLIVREVRSQGVTYELCPTCAIAFCRFMDHDNPNQERP